MGNLPAERKRHLTAAPLPERRRAPSPRGPRCRPGDKGPGWGRRGQGKDGEQQPPSGRTHLAPSPRTFKGGGRKRRGAAAAAGPGGSPEGTLGSVRGRDGTGRAGDGVGPPLPRSPFPSPGRKRAIPAAPAQMKAERAGGHFQS